MTLSFCFLKNKFSCHSKNSFSFFFFFLLSGGLWSIFFLLNHLSNLFFSSFVFKQVIFINIWFFLWFLRLSVMCCFVCRRGATLFWFPVLLWCSFNQIDRLASIHCKFNNDVGVFVVIDLDAWVLQTLWFHRIYNFWHICRHFAINLCFVSLIAYSSFFYVKNF